MKRLISLCEEMLRSHGLLRRGGVLVVAASGGLDSTVLCHVMHQVAVRWDVGLHIAYVHHGLRHEADEEVLFVERLARELDAAFHLARVDVRAELLRGGASVQDAARRLRYAALEQIRAAAHADAVLTAHHADDQAETVLAHVFRGCGVRGFAGIRPVLGHVARPLLRAERGELLTAAEKHGIAWMEDASNDSDKYTRNAIRHHVIPAIERYVSPGLSRVLADTATIFTALQSFLDAHAQSLLTNAVERRGTDGVSLAVPAMKGYFEFERMLVIRTVVADLRASEPSFDELRSILSLLDSEAGRKTVLQGGITALRQGDSIELFKEHGRPASVAVSLGETVKLAGTVFASKEHPGAPALTKRKNQEVVDLQRSGTEWRLRPWNNEDVFEPFGGSGITRVRDFLAAAGFSARRRERIPVLEGEHGIIWVCGVRLDQRAALTERSTRTATIEFYVEQQE